MTLVYAIPVPPAGVRWLDDPRRSLEVEAGREYVHAASFRAGANGRLSTYPLGALARMPGGKGGLALAIDMACPAFYRIGYNAGTGELWIAYDLGLTAEKPQAQLRFCRFDFDPGLGLSLRAARLLPTFPARRFGAGSRAGPVDALRPDQPGQGLGRFRLSVQGRQRRDRLGRRPRHHHVPLHRAHDLVDAHARDNAPNHRGGHRARPAAWPIAAGARPRPSSPAATTTPTARLRPSLATSPGTMARVWSMNSMPGIAGDINDFKTKWNPQIRERLYGPERHGDLDGEYIDSSEGYVTDELDFRRDHFAAAETPLTFSLGTHRPAIFRGLIAFEYIRNDRRGHPWLAGKLMMANATPDRLCWLTPLLDVLGTETDWNPRGKWRPMDDAELLYRRALCKGKPFCFLMNTAFEKFSHELVEKYMKRSLAYGCFPGFFSHNASDGHYFARPELYERDRPLFRKYVPLCRLVAEAGWEPITGARSGDDRIHIERFGDHSLRYLTVFNDSPDRRKTTITLNLKAAETSRELVREKSVNWTDGKTTIAAGRRRRGRSGAPALTCGPRLEMARNLRVHWRTE